jgi:transcriptional regulator with XRE-family HTH domain
VRRGTKAAEQFGEDLKDIRAMKGLSMRAVADVLGQAPAYVSQCEKAQRAVKEDKLDLWAKALGVRKQVLHDLWNQANTIPAPAIVRKRRNAPPAKTLVQVIDGLTSVQRARVLGYIDSLIEGDK